MAIIPQFQASYTATAATTAISTGGIMIHTVVFPKALAGTVSLTDTAGSTTYAAFPVGSIGSIILDIVVAGGLKIVQGSAADQVTITWQSL
jgi:hypothetical protein